MTVKKSVCTFIKKYKVKEITYPILEKIINELGFKIQYFNKYSQKSITIFQNLGIENPSKCFTHAGEDFKCIFISDCLDNDDKTYLLLHEIGHIFLNHIEQNVILDNVKFEKQANEFAFWTEIKLKKRQYILKILMCALILMICLAVFSLIYKDSTDDSYINNTDSIISNEATYYITKTGDKYHKEDCPYISGREVFEETLSELELLGYEPCAFCIKTQWLFN